MINAHVSESMGRLVPCRRLASKMQYEKYNADNRQDSEANQTYLQWEGNLVWRMG